MQAKWLNLAFMYRKCVWRVGCSLLVLSACGRAHVATMPGAHVDSKNEGDALATLDGVSITAADIPETNQRDLQGLASAYAQRRYHLLWSGVEEAVANQVLQREADRRQASLATLLAQEVEAQVGGPSTDEIRDLFEANRQLIGVPFEQAEPLLRTQWRKDRVTQLRQALVDRLRRGSEVHYQLPPPVLPRYQVPLDGPSRGPAQAAVTIVEFADFQCPYSAQARRLLQRLGELYPQNVRVVFRNLPLKQHTLAHGAAVAAQCADEQGRFWPYHDLLFENSHALRPADLRRYASQTDLDVKSFEICLASGHASEAVAQAATAAQQIGVQGTPALFVNGMRFDGVLPLPLMQAIIEQELADAQS